MPNKILEKDIQYQILQYLRLKGIFCWKSNTTGIKKTNGSWIPSGLRGVSDILGLLKTGQFLAIEVKAEKGKLSDNQIEFLDNIKANGGKAIVAFSLDDVIDNL